VRLAHAADIHLGHKQYDNPQRETDVKLAFEHFLGKASEHDVAAILLPGDLFDSRDVSPKTLSEAESVLADVDVPVVVSPGNHDESMSTRRKLTWLQYLNDSGLITLLSANPSDDPVFVRTDSTEPRAGGGGFVDIEENGETVRCFGVPYRGAYIENDLESIAEGIRAVNGREGTPDTTVLLAHFGVEDAVPDLGATVTRASLTPIEDCVDYLALGHIHKRYETGTVGRNPGSLEALDIQEGRWDEGHSYYIFDTVDGTADHHLSHRRPYHTMSFDVSGYRTFEDLRGEFAAALDEERSSLERSCEREIHRDGGGNRREPVVNVRFVGTLLLDHGSFDVEALRELAAERLDALHVQPTNNTERKAIAELLGDIERDEAFDADGTVNTDVLQERVFTTIAGESRYSAETDAVARTLDELEGLVTEDGEGVSEVADYLGERRRELFPEGAADSGDESASDDVGTSETASEGRTSQRTLDARGSE
jgi:exonuclease SbcD